MNPYLYLLQLRDLDSNYFCQDFGYVQTTSTEVLKSYIFNEPIVVDAAHLSPLGPAGLFMVLYHLSYSHFIYKMII